MAGPSPKTVKAHAAVDLRGRIRFPGQPLRHHFSAAIASRMASSSLAFSCANTSSSAAPTAGGRGSRRARPRLEVEHQIEQDLQRARIGGRGFVDELLDHRLALGDLAAPAVLGDRHRLVQRVVQQRRQVFRTGQPPARVPDWPFLKPAPRGGLP